MDGAECTLSKGGSDIPKGCAATQRDLGRLEKWTDKNLMKITKGKCQVLPLRNNFMYQYMQGATYLKSSFAEKDLEILVTTRLNMSQQCALGA